MQEKKKTQPVNTLARKEKRKRSLAQQYHRMRNALERSLIDSYLAEQLAKYGYPREKILEGRELLDRLEQLSREQKTKRGIYIETAGLSRKARKEADRVYARFVKIARLAFQDDPTTLIEFRLKQRRKRDYAGWETEAFLFYNNLLGSPGALSELGKYSVTPDQLEAGKKLLLETQTADQKKLSAYSESQHATETKNKAFTIMKRWFSAFIAVAKAALQENPQFLEKLGIVVPSSF